MGQKTPIYLDNQSTTRVDPRVLEEMLPLFTEFYGNAGSISHQFGHTAQEFVARSRNTIASMIGSEEREIVFTSGATESNNLALKGIFARYQRKGNHIISVVTEHKAILDPLTVLSKKGAEVTLLPVDSTGKMDLQQLEDSITDKTILISVMHSNNEIGTIHPIAEIGKLCKSKGILLHTDATQSVGKLPIDVNDLQVDLMSFSAHKMYGPKGVGGLYIRKKAPLVRIESQIDGGGQERNHRSGTLAVPLIVGLAKALELSVAEQKGEQVRLFQLRNQLFSSINQNLDDVILNGPALDDPNDRLVGNLNLSFKNVEGESLMMHADSLAVSSGSACTSANPEPSYVLKAIGLDEDMARASLRISLGRFNTEAEIAKAAEILVETVHQLRNLV